MAKNKLFAEGQPPADPDLDVLTAEEIAAVEAEAKADVDREAKELARQALKAKIVSDAKRAKGLAAEQVEVTLDLAPYCTEIVLDNRHFLQGVTYTVRATQAQVMREIMQRTWTHQAEIDGKSENFYRRTRGARVVPNGNGAAVVNTSQLLRA